MQRLYATTAAEAENCVGRPGLHYGNACNTIELALRFCEADGVEEQKGLQVTGQPRACCTVV